MILKNKILFLFAALLVASFFGFLPVDNATAGNMIGCCINGGNNCNPGCGPQGTSCQIGDGPGGSCPNVVTLGDGCGGLGATADQKKCFVPDAFCFQVENNTGECVAAPPTPTPTATPSVTPTPVPVCTPSTATEDCNPGLCFDAICPEGSCVYLEAPENDPSCVVGPATIIPTLSQWGIILATVILGFFAVVMLWRSKESELK